MQIEQFVRQEDKLSLASLRSSQKQLVSSFFCAPEPNSNLKQILRVCTPDGYIPEMIDYSRLLQSRSSVIREMLRKFNSIARFSEQVLGDGEKRKSVEYMLASLCIENTANSSIEDYARQKKALESSIEYPAFCAFAYICKYLEIYNPKVPNTYPKSRDGFPITAFSHIDRVFHMASALCNGKLFEFLPILNRNMEPYISKAKLCNYSRKFERVFDHPNSFHFPSELRSIPFNRALFYENGLGLEKEIMDGYFREFNNVFMKPFHAEAVHCYLPMEFKKPDDKPEKKDDPKAVTRRLRKMFAKDLYIEMFATHFLIAPEFKAKVLREREIANLK
jgi:hypothetical protein